jgi:hypothetical protein
VLLCTIQPPPANQAPMKLCSSPAIIPESLAENDYILVKTIKVLQTMYNFVHQTQTLGHAPNANLPAKRPSRAAKSTIKI